MCYSRCMIQDNLSCSSISLWSWMDTGSNARTFFSLLFLYKLNKKCYPLNSMQSNYVCQTSFHWLTPIRTWILDLVILPFCYDIPIFFLRILQYNGKQDNNVTTRTKLNSNKTKPFKLRFQKQICISKNWIGVGCFVKNPKFAHPTTPTIRT